LLERSLYLYRFQENGVPSIPLLRRRAESDQEIARRVLQSFGYYESVVRTSVTPAEDKESAVVELVIEPGQPFILSAHRIVISDRDGNGDPVPPDAKDSGSPVGSIAEARAILAAESFIADRLRQRGYPYASRTGRDAEADLEQRKIAVLTTFRAGPKLVYGDVSFTGIPDVDETYLRTYQPWKKGETVDARQLAEFQRELIDTGLFNAGAVQLPDDPPESGEVPVAVVMEQRPFRTIGGGVWYSTDEGPGIRLEFTHRNLFGANESVNLRATTGLEEQRVETRFRKPQFERPGQDLVAGLSLRNLDNEAFDEYGGTVSAGVERDLTPDLRVGAGGLFELTQSETSGSSGLAVLAGVPTFAAYDTSNDILDPTGGIHLRAEVTPYVGTYSDEFTAFLRGDVVGSTYFPLDDSDRFVLAVRGRVGSVIAQDLARVPAGRRIYSGGGGSVRGYSERSIGPLDASGDPTGGLSVVEGGAEVRANIAWDVGAAVFIEGASVSEEMVPTFSEGVQYAAGVGLRYYSPIGPIRMDVGFPLNPRSTDDSFQIYFSVGQAF
jgi:translocation and assembly module TamA